MAGDVPAVELGPMPDAGRTFSNETTVRLGDVDRDGRMRLDAAARVLQDVATDDARDAGLDRRFGWLVRRTLIETVTPARLGEPIVATTWCAGIGRAWAERRTRIVGARGASIEAVSLWVQVDPGARRPARIGADFTDAYADASGGRSVSARLSLGPEPHETTDGDVLAERRAWAVRRVDLDPFGHVNNAATWALLEDVAALDRTERVGRAELEYLAPIEFDDEIELRTRIDGSILDLWARCAGQPRAAARWTPA